MISIDLNHQNFVKIVHKSHHGSLPKVYDIFSKVLLVFILTKPDSLTTKIISYKEFLQILKK